MIRLACLCLLVSLGSATAQSTTHQFIGPNGVNGYGFAISSNGQFVCGQDLNDGFVWSAATGESTPIGDLALPYGVSDDGLIVAGTWQNAGAGDEAGIWTPAGGLVLQGRTNFPFGCGPDVSWIQGLDQDGDVAGGHVWKNCLNVPARWDAGLGWSLLSTQDAATSARVVAVSGDGQVMGGWDRGLPTGSGLDERACLWLDSATQIFPATSASNPLGLGEVLDLNSDGSVACGETEGMAFRWTASGGLEILPSAPGLAAEGRATGISEDGSVVVGWQLGPTGPESVRWLPSGPIRLVDELASHGVTVDFWAVRRSYGVSADGTTVCGGGVSGPWVAEIPPSETWADLLGGTAGIDGVPQLTGTGELTAGTTVSLALDNAAPNALMVGWLAVGSTTPLNVLGGTLHANPKNLQILRFSDGFGGWGVSLPWPPGVPAGTEVTVQFLVQDLSVPAQITMSNGIAAVSP